jgi:CHAT domain-containing protein
LEGRGAAEIVHVALHGKFDANGTQNGILMIDGVEYLDPLAIAGVSSTPVRLAFLNACQVGQGREMLGVYAGMAAALIGIGVAGVVAPLWKVDDGVAREIAEAFYPAVLAREDRAPANSPAAFLRAQRADEGGGGTRLAYVFFGHPLLRVNWEGQDNDA